ncbi:Trans-enoyl reductase [Colletotrichum sp. SAR11_57]|nr:Trans-enoyl reductase [Colletotrichum sp. SAR11_57]
MALSNTLPSTQTALKITGSSAVALQQDTALPEIQPSDVLVRVAYVSIGPVDSKSAEMSPAVGATSGTEFAGVIVALGISVAGSDNAVRVKRHMRQLEIGDRVVGGIFGNNPLRRDNGAFAEYVAVPARLIWHVPTSMDLAAAVTLPTALATVGLSLFQYMKLPMPSPNSSADQDTAGSWVLVHGGGTSTGCMAIQVLKWAGFRTVTTCGSAESKARAESLGAEVVFDYHSPTCGSDILEHTEGALGLALDCITDTSSMALCYEALGSKGGRYVGLDFFPLRGHTRRSVVPDWVCTYTQFGNPVAWAPPYNLDARPEDLSSLTVCLIQSYGGLGVALASHVSTVYPAYHGIYTVRNASTPNVSLEAAIDPNTSHEVLSLDLGNNASIRAAAASINQRVSSGAIPPIRVLVLNAGFLEFAEQTYSKDGFDMSFAANYLGHFLLTLLLLESLAKERGRVVWVGSNVHDPSRPGISARIYPDEKWQTFMRDGTADGIAKGTWSSKEDDPTFRSGFRRYGAAKMCVAMSV